MSILTKNQTPTKGQKAEFQLNKSQLATIASVAADTYFSNIAHWSHIELVYKSSTGSQRVIVKFDATKVDPVGYFHVSSVARDVFHINKIVINDFDGDEFVIRRGELNTAEFDVSIATLFTQGLTRNFSTSAPTQWYEQLNGGAQIYAGNLVLNQVGAPSQWASKPSYLLGIASLTQVQYRTVKVFFDRTSTDDPDYVPEITVFNQGLSFSKTWGPTPQGGAGQQSVDWFNQYFTITDVPINGSNATTLNSTKIMLTAPDAFGGSTNFRITGIEILPL